MKFRSQIIVIIVVLFVAIYYVRFNNSNNTPPDTDTGPYRYEIVYNPMDEKYTDEVGLNIYNKNLTTGIGKFYTGINSIDLYVYVRDNYSLTEESGKTRFIQFSMTPEYIEGLSADGKFVSGKLMDPNTKKQIGHWTYDLDKKDFSEFTLNMK